MKIRPVGVEILHAGRHDEADVRFSQYGERASLYHTNSNDVTDLYYTSPLS